METDQPTDGGQDPTPGKTQPDPTPTPPSGQDPQVFDAAYVKQLRDEAASYRTKLRETEAAARKHETELKKLSKSQDDAAAKELEEQGKFKELADKTALKLATAEQRLADLETANENATKELDVYKTRIGEWIKAQLDGLSEPIIELLGSKSPLEQLDWLAKYKAQLAGQQPSHTGQQPPAGVTTFSPTGGNGAQETDQQRVARLNRQAGYGQSVFG
jgi:hypothetical protein